MIENKYSTVQYVPVKKSMIYSFMRKEKIADKYEWFEMGRLLKIDPEIVTDHILRIPDGPCNGKSMVASELHNLIRDLNVEYYTKNFNIK